MTPSSIRLFSLKCSALALACAAGALLANPVQAQSGTQVLEHWREYARRGVMPEYSWSDSAGPRVAPTLLDTFRAAERSGLRATSLAAVGFSGARLSVGFAAGRAGEGTSTTPSRQGAVDFSSPHNAIKSEFVSSTYERALGQQGRFGVTAIVARQRYVSSGLGNSAWNAPEDIVGVRRINAGGADEVSAGHGVRLGYWAPLDANLAWSVSAQSKLEMDAFKSFRGMYSEAGDFDVPGRLEARLSWAPTSFATLALGVDRVFYSGIEPFTSAALPTRFLSLLGDGGSPEFEWRDLTVYSVEGIVSDRWDGRWNLRYTTRQQPSPTSALLARALDQNAPDSALLFGYSRAIAGLGELSLNASYATASYFLGATPYSQRNIDQGAQYEVEAVFAVPF